MSRGDTTSYIRYYIRLLFGSFCIIWLFVAIDHYQNDGQLFDYNYASADKLMRRLLATHDPQSDWNKMIKEEFDGSNLAQMNSETSSKILKMIEHDKDAINQNAEQFHKILPEYITAKRQFNIANDALDELKRKREQEEEMYKAMEISTEKEQRDIEELSESGQSQSDTHKNLEKELQDTVATDKKQLDGIDHLIKSTTTQRDQWQKKAETLYQQLTVLMKLDKDDRSIEVFLNRLVHRSSNRECDWTKNPSDCSFQSVIDVGPQFDTHYFTVHNPPNQLNLKEIAVEAEGKDNHCQIKVYIGVNQACSSKPATFEDPKGGEIQTHRFEAREICTTNLTKTSSKADGCDHCKGINFDLKTLKKSLFSSSKSSDGISTFCVIMKRYYPFLTGHNPQCKGKGNVEITEAKASAKGHISCPSPKNDKIGNEQMSAEKQKKTDKTQKTKKRQSTLKGKKEPKEEKKAEEKRNIADASDTGRFGEALQASFGWRRMVGYWPYLATVLAGFIGLGSLFIIIY